MGDGSFAIICVDVTEVRSLMGDVVCQRRLTASD
jgi:hypothetical protein